MAALSILLNKYFKNSYVQKRLGALVVTTMFVCLFTVAVSYPASANWTTPTHTWGGSGNELAGSVAMDSNGNTYIAGRTNSFGAGSNDVLVLKYDATGSLVWAETWGGGGDDSANAIGVGPDGYIYVTGNTSSYGAGWYDVFLLKLGPSGNLVWNTTWGGPSYESANDLAFDGAGNIYVAAESYSSGNSAVVLKFNPAGGLLSTLSWKGPATYDSGYSVDIDPNGNILLAGISWDYSVNPVHTRILLVKYDPNGNLLWSQNWQGPDEDETWGPKVIRSDTAGNVYVLGRTTSFGAGQWDLLLLKLSPLGNLLWATTWGGPGDEGSNPTTAGVGGITFTPNGNVEVVASSNSFLTGPYGAVLLQYSPNGSLLSSRIFAGTGDVLGQASVFDSIGNLVVAGAAPNASGQWQSVSGSTSIPAGSLLSPSFTVSSPAETVGNPSVTLGSPLGTLNVGAGGQDVFVTWLASSSVSVASFPPPNIGQVGGPNAPVGTVAEPVTTSNGNYFYSHSDLVVPGRGLPLLFQRSYNSIDNYSGPLGANWTHSYNIVLMQDATGNAIIKWGDGHGETYTKNGTGYIAQTGVFSTLIAGPSGTFVLTKKDLTSYVFSAAGRLTSIQDRNGNSVLLTYDGTGNLTQVTDAAGRNFTFSYDGSNRVTKISDPSGRSVSFQYDANNNLAHSTDPAGGGTQYTYDVSHRVLTITLPNGQSLLQNAYDASGRVASQTNGRGFATTFAYGSPSPGQTSITDARGNTVVHTYDSASRIVTIGDPLGGTVRYTYDAQNDRPSVTNQNGKTTLFGYDTQGNVTSITDPLGNPAAFSYDGQNNLLSATNPKGKTTAFSYDTKSNLIRIQDATGNATTFAYDGFGQLSSKIDARSNTTTFSYNSFGNLTRITDALGHSTTLSYDGIGRLTSITDPNGHAAGATYDALSRLTKITNPLGNQTQFAYDAIGNLLKITDAKGNATNYAYDATNNLVSVTDALGHITRYAYDANNNRVGFTNAKANTTAYAYDALNRLMRVTDPLSFVSSYSYDAIGNVLAATDAKGQTNQFVYDALNRLLGISYADGKSVAYAYDADGNRTAMTDFHGTTAYSYDALDRITSVTHPSGKVVSYAYDAVGNRRSLTYPDGKVVSYAYDQANRLSQATDWLARITTYSYDAASNLTRTAYPNGAAMAFSYDAANRLTNVVNVAAGGAPLLNLGYTLDSVGNRTALNANGITTQFAYDPLYELISAQLGILKSTWTYDSVGNRMKEVSPLGTTLYTYDAADRLLQAGTRTFTYDANGNQVSATKTLSGVPVAYQYDATNRLIAAQQGKSINSTFGYDGDGNRITQATGKGTYNYLNDIVTALPVVLQESGPDGNITYGYGLGLIEEFSPSFNNFYHYDGLGSVIALTNSAGKPQAAYVYDPWGNALLSVSDSVGTKNKFRFTGEALDPETQLYFLRARYYDTSVGRLVSSDIFQGFSVRPFTSNRYIYAINNPIFSTDPSGLSPDGVNNQINTFASSPLASAQTSPTPTPAGASNGTVAKEVVSCALGLVSAGVLGGCLETLLEDGATSLGLKVFVKDPQTRNDLDLLSEPSFFNSPSQNVQAQLRLLNKTNNWIDEHLFGIKESNTTTPSMTTSQPPAQQIQSPPVPKCAFVGGCP